MLGKRLIKSGAEATGGANTFASENFNTVLYTGNGSSQKIGGYINRGAVFNGSSSYIDLGNNSSNNGSLISVSCWFKTTSTASEGMLWNNGANDSQSTGLALSVKSPGVLFFQANTLTTYVNDTGTTTVNDGNWHHVVVNYDNGDFNVYLDGNSTPELTGTSSAFTTTANRNFIIGRLSRVAVAYFNGVIDQFRIFNRELITSEVTTLYGETHSSTTISTTDIFGDNSGVALYQLDGNANDSSGYSLTEQNVTVNQSSSNYFAINHTTTSGKYYFEVDYKTTVHSTLMIGLYTSGYVGGWQNSRSRSYYGSNGNKYQGSSPSSYGSTFTAGDIIGVAFDGDNDTITFYKNGTSQGTAFSGNTADSSFGIQLSTGYYAETASLLLSSSDWNYSAPTGFGEWTGAITALNAGNYTTSGSSFNTVTNTYNGTASNITYQEATKFTPDLVWIKQRNGTQTI